MPPFISVCVPTMRVGGLDLLFEGLAQQEFKDFELVLADGIFKHRATLVSERAMDYDFPVKHVEPRGNNFPVNAFCKVANEALAHAEGEVVVFLVDYTFLPPGILAAHARFHHSQTRRDGLMCPHDYFEPPALHPSFERYGQDEIERYCSDLEAGRLDKVLWSLFADPVRPGASFTQPDQTGYAGADPKVRMAAGGILPSYLHAKNESVRRSALRAINGWDEALDGTHCYQDSDLSDRLAQKAGIGWTLDPAPVAQIVNPRRVFPFPRRLRPVEDNLRIWKERQAAGYPGLVNDWIVGL